MAEMSRDPDRQREFDRIVHEYYCAVERGESPRPKEFIAMYPSFGGELESFFSDVQHLEGAPPFAENPIRTVSQVADLKVEDLSPDDLPKTSEFIRDYLLLKKLGEGGFGAVYLAVHTQLEKRVAIKVLKGDRGRDRKSVERFRREIKAVGRFEHNHIVRALDAGNIDGLYFLVMEFIDGYDLSQLVSCCGPLSVADACELARQAALGLHHAHQIGLIHRDVKPSNLMLTAEGQVKLLDLGLAQLTQRYHQTTALTVDGQAMGTLKYMAPEQFQDCRSVSANCDVYSLGVTLYELLRGSLPASGLQAPIDYSDLNSYREDVSGELVELIGAMTEVDPGLRKQDAGEVADLLGQWTKGHDLPKLFMRVRDRKGIDAQDLPASPNPKAGHNHPRQNLVRRGLRSKSWPAMAFAALMLFVLGSAWLATAWLSDRARPDPVNSTNGLLHIVATGTADDDVADTFTGVIVNEASGQIHNLQIGLNQLPAADYRLELGEWESNVPVTFALASSQDLTIYVQPPTPSFRSDFHVLFPRIPDTAGAFACFHASIGPAQAASDNLQTYDITLRSLNKEVRGDTDCQWLEVVVENLNVDRYRETAFVLVDSRLYELEKELKVLKGYVQAEFPRQADVLSSQLQNTPTAEWSDEFDSLKDLADSLQIPLPDSRISVFSLLCVLFDYSHPAVPKEISSLRARLGVAEREFAASNHVSDNGRTISSIQIFSKDDTLAEGESNLGYFIERARDSQEAPFSFLSVGLKSAQLSVKFTRQRAGTEGDTQSVNLDELELAASRAREVTSLPPDDFTRALLPESAGEACRYSAELSLGKATHLTVVADVRSGNAIEIDGRRHRWVEAWLPNAKQGAMLLIDEDAYRNGKRFVVSKGWYQLNGEVFDFAGGDTTIAEESLRWLDKPGAKDLFKVHEVLALLFDADLPSVTERLKELRTEIPLKVGQANAKREPDVCVINATAADQQTFLGKEYVLVSDDDVFPFKIQFSREIPFGFGLVRLSLPGFEITTRLVESRHDTPPLLGNEMEMRERAAATQSKLDNKGVRVWSNEGQVIVRQFNAYLRGDVRLNDDPDSKRYASIIDWDRLSPADRSWIFATQGHDWDCLKQLGKQRSRALIESWGTSGETVNLLWDDGEKGEVINVSKRTLSARDLDYEKAVLARIR